MKINFDYYSGQDIYSDGEIEEDIIKYIDENNNDFSDILKTDMRWAVFYHLNSTRQNIINWYPFKEDCEILEIGAGMGALTGFLCEKAKSVTAIELSKRRAEAIAKRYNTVDNLELLVGNLNDIQIQKKFDYITLIGVLEYAPSFTESENPFETFLNNIKSYLKPDGKLLIAIENRFGIKYFAGAPEDHSSVEFTGLMGYEGINSFKTFGRIELENLLTQGGFSHTQFYYPLPDYKFPNVIFSDYYLPNENNVLRYNKYYAENSIVLFNEHTVFSGLISESKELLKYFANSFFVEAGFEEYNNKVKAVFFSNHRNEKYRLMTVLKEDVFEKYPISNKSVVHLNHLKNNIELLKKNNIKTVDENNCGIFTSNLVQQYTFLEQLYLIKDKVILLSKLKEYKEWLLTKSCKIAFEDNNILQKYVPHLVTESVVLKLNYLKNGFWDLVPSKCFIIDSDYVFFDQEWMEENVPVEFILFRTVRYNRFLRQMFGYETLCEELGILNEFKLFEQLDNFLQNEINDDINFKYFSKTYKSLSDLKQELKEINNNLTLQNEKYEKLQSKYKTLKSNNDALHDKTVWYRNELMNVYDSLSWKMTKLFRMFTYALRFFMKFIIRILRALKRKLLPGTKKIVNIFFPLGTIRRERLRQVFRKIFPGVEEIYTDVYNIWLKNNTPDKMELLAQQNKKFDFEPKISVVVPMYNTPEKYFSELINSLKAQTYQNWELCLADGSTEKPTFIDGNVNSDSRIKYQFLGGNRGIAGNSNAALALASGDYIALTDHDDLLPPNCFYEIVNTLNAEPEADFIYTDEDKIDADGITRYDPHFKSDFAIDSLRSNNYICHMSIFKKSLMDIIHGWNSGFDGSQDHDLILRAIEQAQKIVHIPKVLYHWRVHSGSVAIGIDAKPYAIEAGVKAVQSHLDRMHLNAVVKAGKHMGFYDVTYLYTGKPRISIIIPNKDHVEDLQLCIQSILQTEYVNYEIIIVENNSTKSETFFYYKNLQNLENIRVVYYKEKGFNFSKIINFGVAQATGDYLVLLNNDVEIKTENWLEILLGFAQREDVGAVGVKLYFPDDTVQHAGVVLGMGVASHVNLNCHKGDPGYMGKLIINQNFSAVTAACMMVSRENFYSVNGFNEDLAVAYNDVDFCLKLREKNKLIVFTPMVEGIHYESKSRGNDNDPDKIERFNEEQEYIYQKWAKYYKMGDPYFNPNFRLDVPQIRIKTNKVEYR